MKILMPSLFIISILAFSKGNAQTVDKSNGNMNVFYTDVVFQMNHPVNFVISKSYNSISNTIGIFGLGWTSNYETNVLVIPGGGVALYNWGNNLTVYEPRVWDKQDIAIQVNKMVAEAIKKVEVKSPEQIAELKELLINNQEKRIKKFREFISHNPDEKLELSAGTKLISAYGGESFLEASVDGFKLENLSSRNQFFDSNGRLIKEENKAGNFVLLSYDDENNLHKINDDFGNYLIFNFKDGMVQSIDAENIDGNKSKAIYTYDFKAKTLTSSTDIAGNHYGFDWDNAGGMTKIKYDDGKDAKITYDPVSYRCTSVTKKDGSKNTYEYPIKSSNEYGNVITYFDSLGVQLKKVSNWYVFKTNDLGVNWKYKWQIVENSDSTFYVYNEKFETPDTVYKNNRVFYTFSYTKKGNLKEIFKNGKTLVAVQIENERLVYIKSAKELYIPKYENQKIAKMKVADGSEIALPLKNLNDDPKNYKADILTFIGTFKYTNFWYDISAQLY